MPETIPLEKHDVHAVRASLGAGDEVPGGPPGQRTLHAVDGLAHAVEDAIAGEHADDSSNTSLDGVDGDVGTVAPPADGSSAVVAGAEHALVYLFRYRRVSQSFGTLALELGLLLTPANRDVFGQLEVVGGHGRIRDPLETATHENDRIRLGGDGQ